jgi:hypothetical protein
MNDIKSPFDNVPLNTTSVFVKGVVPDGGCEIYLPIATTDEAEAKIKKNELQYYLDENFPFENKLA